ncbi:hypothetical protein RHMOL_Rhmol11G0083800 [Rhododendron molle]|uniref:Uncharacterized protein n=1 Tax=Rhododendron molle TaxID=49168 RepID=A0ACC0LRH6_RHOML|nr:hypothetical protein RHMOL_Rhmol11G0083800 [Rhododendron molle]
MASLFHNKYPIHANYPSEEFGLVRSCLFHGVVSRHSISAREVIVCTSSRGLKEPGTSFKNLMAILWDVICYDGTVRNVTIQAVMIIFLYSNQVLRSDPFRGGATRRPTETFSLSSQPKCGFLPFSRYISEGNVVKKRIACCGMHQSLKLHEREVSEISEYDTLDIFSGSKDRVHKAIKALFVTPQNNFRVFLNGFVIYGGLGGGGDSINHMIGKVGKKDVLSCNAHITNGEHQADNSVFIEACRTAYSDQSNTAEYVSHARDPAERLPLIVVKGAPRRKARRGTPQRLADPEASRLEKGFAGGGGVWLLLLGGQTQWTMVPVATLISITSIIAADISAFVGGKVVSSNRKKVKRLHPLPASEVTVPRYSCEWSLSFHCDVISIKNICIRDPHAAREPKKRTIAEKLLSGKPKCGFLPFSRYISEGNVIKMRIACFRMHQSLKLHEREVSEISEYDLLDMFLDPRTEYIRQSRLSLLLLRTTSVFS